MGGGYHNRSDTDKIRTEVIVKKLQRTDIGKKRDVFLFLDFDGTLARIVGHPKDAVIRPDAKEWLKKVLKKNNIKVAIVTGRSLSDIRRRVGLHGSYYVANHGMEVFYKNRFLLKKGHQFKKPLKIFGDEIITSLAHIHGIVIEEKGLSVAVHFRRVERKYRGFIKSIVHEIAAPIVKKHNLQITKGKMLLELRPVSVWNKGKAVEWLWKKIAPESFPIYIGDDMTDEDAFLAIKPYGFGIRIGKKKHSHAKYYINSIRTFINCGEAGI